MGKALRVLITFIALSVMLITVGGMAQLRIKSLNAEASLLQRVENEVAEMSVEDKIGQLFIMDFRVDEEGNPLTELTPEVINQIWGYHIGGVILFAENIETESQITQLVTDMQNSVEIPLFIVIEETQDLEVLEQTEINYIIISTENEEEEGITLGEDIILMPDDLQEAYNAVLKEVKNGILTEAELDERVEKILLMKYELGVINLVDEL